ncbi:MAG: PEP-CTERM sorting domain-containing protein [Kiloniellaceae bacterium]
MLKNCLTALALGAALTVAAVPLATPAQAVLMNHGTGGEYFYDTATGLYWWDPAAFVNQSKAEIDAYVAANTDWQYASYQQLQALNGQISLGGVPLDEIIGREQFRPAIFADGTAAVGRSWIGFYDGLCPLGACIVANPNGWIVGTLLTRTPLASDLTVVGYTSYQTQVELDPLHGAWSNSLVDPLSAVTEVAEPATLGLFAAGLAGLGVLRRRRRG